MINRERILNEFYELVQVDSETKHEEAISVVLKQKFGELGLQVVEDDTREVTGHGSGNLICTLEATPGHEAAPAVFFTGHMDTVVPGNGIKPRLDDDGFIRSDGTTILGSDDKAGLAAMFEAIRVLKEQNIAHGKLLFVITAGEESHLIGSRSMKPGTFQADYGYALDCNGSIGEMCTQGPTHAQIKIKIYGKAAHAGVSPESGISAIQVASKAISRMPLGRVDHETTANIGRFEGGTETNVVCDYVYITAEARSLKDDKLAVQVDKMRKAFEETAEEFGARVEFDSHVIYPAYHFDNDSQVVRVAFQALEQIGLKGSTFKSGGGSDVNMFNGLGIPSINLSVGYEDIHTTKERIKADDIVKLTEFVVAIIQESVKEKKA
ncbi:M20/M25/M40 family metallo-hydrolase [Paenibacillus turpanensis]|uniref:M20/M25/M40 family metallo-hydrolase n=1 Tax=Paenibacillus turpanensis TaxID=2689078 RepID=UPI00140858A1|nr:M20/M25/M40 family metallo-hydrolase [Paenibacillus turpanensis]